MTIAESLFSNLSVNIKFFCDIHHNNTWQERKTKADYTLWHIHQGKLWIEMNDRIIPAEEGDVVLFYPGDTYRAYTDEDGCSFLVTFFTMETGNKMDLLENRPFAGVYHNLQVTAICDSFCRDYHRDFQDNMSPTLQHYASFIRFLAELLSNHTPTHSFHNAPVSPVKMPLHDVLNYMNEHFLESVSVRDLGNQMGMSEKYFIQYFHAHVGTSPKQYLVEKRMKHALLLLADKENSLSYTAAKLGYSDQYAFSKAFKKYYGEAPSFFRTHLL